MTRTEETLLDPPITPAPIFAYRALRGLIFGSPDPNSSPERVVQHRDKENVSPLRLGTIAAGLEKGNYTPKRSPQKRKRGNEVLSLSPSIGLSVPVSPTKSILRTPGVPTPRAKALRDVNVKFRSLSPEVRRKNVKHATVLEDIVVTKPIIQLDAERAKKSHTASEAVIKEDVIAESTARTGITARPGGISESDFQDYERRTQKEMKMLIKQGQKWREYARLQDEDNAKLRQLLEQAQKENERLARKLRLAEKPGSISIARPTRDGIIQDPMAEEMRRRSEWPKNGSREAQPTKCAIVPDPMEEERQTKKAKTAPSIPDPFASRSISSSLESRLSQLRQPSVPGPSSSRSAQTLPTRPSKSPASILRAISRPAQPPAAPFQSPLTALAQKLEPEPSPHTSTRTNLAPERYSAARQRIRQRQQARKASGVLSQVAEEEGSNIDWAGLG